MRASGRCQLLRGSRRVIQRISDAGLCNGVHAARDDVGLRGVHENIEGSLPHGIKTSDFDADPSRANYL
jgi:hypothetical protein